MLQSLHFVPFLYASLISICAVSDYRKLFIPEDTMNIEKIFSCVNSAVVRLFNDGNQIGVLCHNCGHFENEIIKMFMKNQSVIVGNRPLPIEKQRVSKSVGYVVFTNESFKKSWKWLQEKGMSRLQYLFVNTANEEAIIAFADNLWRASFRDIAFLTLDDTHQGTIQVPVKKEAIMLKSVGYCSPFGDSLNHVVPYSSDFYRFCEKKPCTLLYSKITDETVRFWREEDRLKLLETKNYLTMGSMLINRFTSFYGIELRYKYSNLKWQDTAEKLINGDLDIVVGLMPENIEIMKGLEVVCWFRNRNLVFAGRVRHRLRNYPVLQLLTTFHYSVWICTVVTLLVYVLLICALRRLANVRLIKERLNYMQIYEIMMGQSVTFPKKTSLRAVLALWMIFSLNLSIIYNSTFTSSLAEVDTEDLLKDLKELRDSGMSLCGPPIIRSLLNDSDDPIITDLYDRYTTMKGANETFDAIFSKNTMAVVQKITVDRINWATKTNRSLRMYSLLKPVLEFPVLFYTRTEHPYRVPFEHIVAEYRESGLLYKWVKYYVIDEDKQIASFRKNMDDDSGILTMEHLGPVFQFFFTCQAISVLIFFIELLKFRILKI